MGENQEGLQRSNPNLFLLVPFFLIRDHLVGEHHDQFPVSLSAFL